MVTGFQKKIKLQKVIDKKLVAGEVVLKIIKGNIIILSEKPIIKPIL